MAGACLAILLPWNKCVLFSRPPPPFLYLKIIFNVCGTVANVIAAPYSATNPSNLNLPLPHSHGTAVQLIDDPGQDSAFTCPDADTCDQDTNPDCVPGSLNYDPNRNGPNPYVPGLVINHNVGRETRCANNCPNGAPGPGCPYYCYVASTPCEGNVEVLAYYDGAPPVSAQPSSLQCTPRNRCAA